jgi:hypothetical protein
LAWRWESLAAQPNSGARRGSRISGLFVVRLPRFDQDISNGAPMSLKRPPEGKSANRLSSPSRKNIPVHF